MAPLIINLPTTTSTRLLGQRISLILKKGEIILLSGESRSGKSTLAHSVIFHRTGCRRLPISSRLMQLKGRYRAGKYPRSRCPICCTGGVALMETYMSGRFKIAHSDLGCGHYGRIDGGGDLGDAFLNAASKVLEEGAIIVEWPEKMRNLFTSNTLEITMKSLPNGDHEASILNITGWENRIETLSKV